MQVDDGITGKSAQELAAEWNVGGMTIKEISIALNIPYGTVYGWLRKGMSDRNGSGKNADRHLCRTCRYRASSYERNKSGINCNYCDLMKESRGCKAKDCTVYVKGPIMKRKKSVREGGEQVDERCEGDIFQGKAD